MFLNAYYKAFVAETAAKVAAELSTQYAHPHDLSMLKTDETAEQIAIAAVNVADAVAGKLEDWWRAKGNGSTVMFDPQESPYSRIEDAISDVAQHIDDMNHEGSLPVYLTNDQFADED